MKIIDWFKKFTATTDDEIYNYLACSQDLDDLEKRHKLVMMGQAPFQKNGLMKARL
jgi:hypothetical protein